MTEMKLRTMTESEIDIAIDWAAAEGWDPGLNDKRAFLSIDKEAFLGSFVDGELVGCISVVLYDKAFAFLGFFIVSPPHRGRGLGFAQLWAAALARAGGRRVIGLDGVVAQQANYTRSAFVLAYRNIRYRGSAGDSKSKMIQGNTTIPTNAAAAAVAVTAVDSASLQAVQAIVDYDAAIFPAQRAPFVRAWLGTAGHISFSASRKSSGVVCGYVVARETRSGGYKIGPLFADDHDVATSLLGAVLDSVPPSCSIFLDVPSPNAAACGLVQDLGWLPCFETARMYRSSGCDPAADDGSHTHAQTHTHTHTRTCDHAADDDARLLVPDWRVWGVTSFELG